MDAFDVVGLLPTFIEIVRDRVVGYDDQIIGKFDHAIAKALRPTAKYDDLYIKNAMHHMAELIGLLVHAYDNPAGIENIELPSYINKEEFRRLYNQTQKDKELVNVLKDEWNYYITKDTNNRVKAIQAEVVILTNEIKKVGEDVGEVKENTGEIKEGLGELKADVNKGFNKLNERLDDLEDKKESKKNVNVQSLDECLKKKLKQKREHHPSFRLMDIDASLFPNGMVTFDTKARDSNNELKTVRTIVAESWERDETNHLMIEGEGGIGKTVALLSLPDNFAPHPVPAIYIPLHELKEETNTIEKYIRNRVLDSKEQYDLLQEVVKKPWNEGPHLLLLLDGFNEIAVEHREAICEDIEQWSELSGLQIITSSRFDIHQYVALRSNFSKIELQPLSEERVSEYLVNNKIGVPDNPAVIKLITIPLLLTLYIKAETIRNDRPSSFAKFKDTKNAGLLIWNYLQCELWPFRNKKAEAKACILALEFIAPYIAWTMRQHSEFVLDESSFFDRIDEAYHLLKSHVEARAQLPDHIKTTLRQSSGLPSSEHIGDLLKEHLCLFVNNEGVYRLMHQQFRDALAAIHLINISYLSGESLPQEWNTPIDYYVMQFVVDLISEDEAIRLWEQNRKTTPTIENATINQLSLQGLLRDNDFSQLNFSGIDLSEISLYSYRDGDTLLKLPANADNMEDTVLSKKTFFSDGHIGQVEAVAVTPDGRFFVSGSRDKTIRIWNLESGICLKTLEGGEVCSVAVTPDSRRIISGSLESTICIWDMDNWTCLKTLNGHKNRVNIVLVTSDGRRIVSGSLDNTIRVWDLESGDCLKILQECDEAIAVAVTPDGKRIVSGSLGNTIRVWDMNNWTCLKTLKGHEKTVETVAVTPDGMCIVSGSCDHTIRIWDLESGDCLRTLEGHKDTVFVVAVTLDGRRIISGSLDNTIRVWDLESGDCLKTLEGHKATVYAIAVTMDNRRIISVSSDYTIRIWDLESGDCLKIIEGHENRVNAVAVTPDGRRIVSGLLDCTIRIWNVENGGCLIKILEGHKNSVKAVVVTPDGRRIVSGSFDKNIRIWDIVSGTCLKTLEGHKEMVTAVAVTPDGRRVVSGSWDNTIRVWDLESGTCLKTLEGHWDWVNAVTVTPDGKYIVSGSSDYTVRIWDLESGSCLVTLEGSESFVETVAVTPDGKYIVWGTYNRSIHIWSTDSWNCLKKMEGYLCGVNAVVVHAAGRHFYYGINDIILDWDGECLKPRDLYGKGANVVAMTPDSNSIDNGFKDRTIRIDDWGKTLWGHERCVDVVSVTKDSKCMVSGSWDNTIRVWDLESRTCLKTITGYEDGVNTIAVTPDGWLIVNGNDSDIDVINMETGDTQTIHILPLSLVGLDFSKAIISSPELKETLRQNGAKV